MRRPPGFGHGELPVAHRRKGDRQQLARHRTEGCRRAFLRRHRELERTFRASRSRLLPRLRPRPTHLGDGRIGAPHLARRLLAFRPQGWRMALQPEMHRLHVRLRELRRRKARDGRPPPPHRLSGSRRPCARCRRQPRLGTVPRTPRPAEARRHDALRRHGEGPRRLSCGGSRSGERSGERMAKRRKPHRLRRRIARHRSVQELHRTPGRDDRAPCDRRHLGLHRPGRKRHSRRRCPAGCVGVDRGERFRGHRIRHRPRATQALSRLRLPRKAGGGRLRVRLHETAHPEGGFRHRRRCADGRLDHRPRGTRGTDRLHPHSSPGSGSKHPSKPVFRPQNAPADAPQRQDPF